MAISADIAGLAGKAVRKAFGKTTGTASGAELATAARTFGNDAVRLSGRRTVGTGAHQMTIAVDGKVVTSVRTKAPGVIEERQGKTVRTMLANFPQAMQHNNYTCGVGSAQSVMGWFRIWAYQDSIGEAAGTTAANGTTPQGVVNYLNKFARDKGQRLHARIQEGLSIADLKAHIDAGRPVIIDYQAYGRKGINYAKAWEDGHYSVVTGYDNHGKIYLMDPSGALGQTNFLTEKELLSRWRDYEVENGQRREYLNMGIVVEGKHKAIPRFAHTD